MSPSNCNGVEKENGTVIPERQLHVFTLDEPMRKERWDRMRESVRNNVDYMDANHWMYLNTAIEQVESFMCLPNPEISYRKAFIRLNKEVREDYVRSELPEIDIHEETYHLLKYFEEGHAKFQNFKTYMQVKKEALATRTYSGNA